MVCTYTVDELPFDYQIIDQETGEVIEKIEYSLKEEVIPHGD